MTGEEKRMRSKRCLSRNKRSKPEKSSDGEPSTKANGEVFTAVRSKQTDCVHPNGRLDHLENELEELSEESSDIFTKVRVVAGKSKSHKSDAFEFCDDDDDDDAVSDGGTACVVGNEARSNKRKRIGSEELETSCFTNTISRFKRARKAVSNLKQPIVHLEKCTDSRESKLESKQTDESTERKKRTANTEVLTNKLGSLHVGEVATVLDNTVLPLVDQELEFKAEKKDNLNNICEGENADNTNLQSQQDFELADRKTDFMENQACPVCSLTFLPTENMDVINKHINSCLDNGPNNRITESALTEPAGERIEEDLYFCQLCQKDLSKMNSQRRQQHINRCCDQASKAKEMSHLNDVQGQTSNQLQCPICGKGFKSSKSRQPHLKKCAQEYNVDTNQLLEIMRREKQQEDSTSVANAGADATSAAVAPTNVHPGRVKRKTRGVIPKGDLDEQTQIALALSASMAPPPPPVPTDKKSGKGKGKKNKGGNELPPLLLRDDETAHRAVAMRAAQVLCTQDGDEDDDEISCTPALAPSRLAQNVPSYHLPVPVGDACSKIDSVSKSDRKDDEDESMDENSEHGIESDDKERGFEEAAEPTFSVDPALSKSFLNFLYDVEIEEKQGTEVKAPRPSPLWSLAAVKDHSSEAFYVPGLLPPVSPRRQQKLPQMFTAFETTVRNENDPTKLNGQAVDVSVAKDDKNLTGSNKVDETVAQTHVSAAENSECLEITPSQAVNVDMLMELVGEDDISNTSMDSQQMTAASGFCVEEENKESETIANGVPKLLQDLSSMINNSHLSDVIFKLKDGQEMVAHSFILSLRSQVLAQLLSEQRALSKKAASCEWTDKVCLNFYDVNQSAFEVVVRHIYTGDVTIPNDCDLDDVTTLAERLQLPCLVKACKVTQEQMNPVYENQDDVDKDDCIATDLEKLEENLWRNDNDDDDFQTRKDKGNEDDFLNDDDIEEIMIFQTQSLKRKGSGECEDFGDCSRLVLPRLAKEEGLSTTVRMNNSAHKNCVEGSHDVSSSPLSENTGEKLRTSFGEDHLSCKPAEKDNLSHNPVEEGNLSHNPVVTVTLSHSPPATGNLSLDPVENRESIQHDDYSNMKERDDFLSWEEKNADEEEMIIDNEQRPPHEENVTKKELPQMSSMENTDAKKQVAPAHFEEKLQMLSCDNRLLSHESKERDVMICASSTKQACIQNESVGNLDEVLMLPEDHVQSNNKKSAPARQLETKEEEHRCNINEELSDVDEVPGMNFELDYNADFANMPIDLLNNSHDEEDDDANEVDEAHEIHETFSDFQPQESEGIDLHLVNSHKAADKGQSLPGQEGRCDDEEDFQGSTKDVTALDDYEMEETVANESITLISDNEEEVLDVSPPKTDITIVPETPRVARPGSLQSASSSALSVSEEDDDVSVSGCSPSKSRKQLNEEANEFLSKLKQRAGRSKGKRQGKEKTKKGSGVKESPVESSAKHTTPKKQSPHGRQESYIGLSPLSSDLRTSPRGSQSVSPMRTSPRGFQSPRGSQNRSASPVILQETCVPDRVTIECSPPTSPILRPHNDSPQTPEMKRKERENSSGPCVSDFCARDSLVTVQKLNSGDPSDVEVVESCVDRSAVNMYRALGLSTSSSPRDVMSPPVPSPDYSFMDPVSSPGSPVPCASPQPPKIALSPDPSSPSLPVDWKSPASERGLETSLQSNSPVSPSVCSFSSQILSAGTQSRKEDHVKKLNLEQSYNDREVAKTVEIKEIDPSVPLMERLRAARNGGQKISILKSLDDSGSDTDCDIGSKKDEIQPYMKKSPIVSSQQADKDSISAFQMKEMENISIGDDFDFYDDGGYNFDINELNNLENCLEDNKATLDKQESSHSKETKPSCQEKGAKAVAGIRKIPLSQRRVEDSDDDEDKPSETQKKRGKKTVSQSHKTAGHTVSQPVTPMPNYNDMATPVLKNELNKFGVRPLPKKKMILKLKEIYDYTHQVEPPQQESKTEHASNAGKPLSRHAEVSEADDGVEGSGTASSDNSDEEDTEFGDCTVMIEDEVITASQQVNGGNLKERLTSYIQNNKELYRKVLKFEPLELVPLHQQIKSDGISCALGKLVDFLDEQCITFTTAGSRQPRAPRKRGRKKKINNKP